MASISFVNVSKRFGKTEALKKINLEIKDKEFLCVLGPPGAGKTTLLRTIMGLEKPEEGDILIDGQRVNNVHPGKRDLAIMFQNLALYPDKTVFKNLAFPLKIAKVHSDEIKKRVHEVARTLQIEPLLDRVPAKLSGGERQRVALGRALVRHPKAFLLDEPLSNLDALLRLNMRAELKRLQTEIGETFVYSTYDQVEAMSMGDRIAVLNKGALLQCGTAEEIYLRPCNTTVARAVGSPPMNLLPCTLTLDDGKLVLNHGNVPVDVTKERERFAPQAFTCTETILGVRPEDVYVRHQPTSDTSVPATVYVTEPLGNETIVDLQVESTLVKAAVPPTVALSAGERVWLDFELGRIHVFDGVTQEAVFNT